MRRAPRDRPTRSSQPIRDQAEIAADTLCGIESAYEGSIPTAKLKVMGVDLVTAGTVDGAREVIVADAGAGVYRKLVTAADGTVLGAVLLGDARGAELLTDAVRRTQRSEDPLGLLAAASVATAAELPDDAQICNCNGVSKGDLVAAVREGGAAAQGGRDTTRAGSGCGSCKRSISMLLAIDGRPAAEEPAYCARARRQTASRSLRSSASASSLPSASSAARAGWTRLRSLQARALVSDRGAASRSLSRGAARALHQRSRPREYPERRHVLVVPRIHGGVSPADELRRIADVADKYELPMVKITGGQRIDLLGVRKEQLPAIWEDLGMPSGTPTRKPFAPVKTCVGTDFCRFGLGDSIALGIEHRGGASRASSPRTR